MIPSWAPAETGKFAFTGESDRSVADVLRESRSDGGDPEERREAASWIKAYLAEAGGTALVKDVLAAGKVVGYAEQTLKTLAARWPTRTDPGLAVSRCTGGFCAQVRAQIPQVLPTRKWYLRYLRRYLWILRARSMTTFAPHATNRSICPTRAAQPRHGMERPKCSPSTGPIPTTGTDIAASPAGSAVSPPTCSTMPDGPAISVASRTPCGIVATSEPCPARNQKDDQHDYT